MLHLFDGFLANLLRHPLIAPVFAHLGVQKILVDRGKFSLEHFVQNGNNLRVAFHCSPLFFFLSCPLALLQRRIRRKSSRFSFAARNSTMLTESWARNRELY